MQLQAGLLYGVLGTLGPPWGTCPALLCRVCPLPTAHCPLLPARHHSAPLWKSFVSSSASLGTWLALKGPRHLLGRLAHSGHYCCYLGLHRCARYLSVPRLAGRYLVCNQRWVSSLALGQPAGCVCVCAPSAAPPRQLLPFSLLLHKPGFLFLLWPTSLWCCVFASLNPSRGLFCFLYSPLLDPRSLPTPFCPLLSPSLSHLLRLPGAGLALAFFYTSPFCFRPRRIVTGKHAFVLSQHHPTLIDFPFSPLLQPFDDI